MLPGSGGGLFGPAQCSMGFRDLIDDFRQAALVGGANLILPMLQRVERFSCGLAPFIAQRCQFLDVEVHDRFRILHPLDVTEPPWAGILVETLAQRLNRQTWRLRYRLLGPLMFRDGSREFGAEVGVNADGEVP